MKFFKKFIPIIILFLSVTKIYALENQDVIALTQPATVKIIKSVKGTISLPNFVFDYQGYAISTTTLINGYTEAPISRVTQGTGFIISEDGVVVTDSKILLETEDAVYKQATEKYLETMPKDTKESDYSIAYKTIYNYFKNNSIKKIDVDIKVLKPHSNQKNIQGVLSEAYAAKVIYLNPSAEGDKVHVALLKIEAAQLPTVSLSNYPEGSQTVGQKIYTIGYPAIPLKGEYVSEPIFTQGIVNALKKLNEINLFQVGSGMPETSNGAPVVDEEGKVVGMLTSVPGSFDFAVPSSYIAEILASTATTISPSMYSENYIAGVSSINSAHCEKALEAFIKSQGVNPDFSVAEFVSPKIDTCNSLIASGQSRDSVWSEIMYRFKINPVESYVWISIILLLISLLIFDKYFLNRFRKDEEKINRIMGDEIGGALEESVFAKSRGVKPLSKFGDMATGEMVITKLFDPMEQKPLEVSSASMKIMPIEKVEVPKHAESAEAIVTPPNAIQPQGALVVIAPFKTLNSPITSRPQNLKEMQKDIKTDLPPRKKEGDSL